MLGDLDVIVEANPAALPFGAFKSPLAPLKTYKSPACGSRTSACCTCNANPFIPFSCRSGRPARHTRTPPERVLQLDLDQPRFLVPPPTRGVIDRRGFFQNRRWQ